VMITLGVMHPSVKIYDPTIGTEPVQTLTSLSSLQLTLSDHPIVIEIR
jgi:hypothetical protein